MDFSAHPVGSEFKMFAPPHLVVLGGVLAGDLTHVSLRSVLGEAGRSASAGGAHRGVLRRARSVARRGGWDVRSDLPLHLCDLTALLSIALLRW